MRSSFVEAGSSSILLSTFVDARHSLHRVLGMRFQAALIRVADQSHLAAVVIEADRVEHTVGRQPLELVLDVELPLLLRHRLRTGNRRRKH